METIVTAKITGSGSQTYLNTNTTYKCLLFWFAILLSNDIYFKPSRA